VFRIKRDPAKLLGSALARSTPPLGGYKYSQSSTMKLTLIVLAILWICPTACSQTPDESPNIDMLESVFRYKIPRCFKELSPDAYFLSYLKHDPTDALMDRLASRGLRVKKRSQFSHFKDRDTGKWSVILAVTDVQTNGASRVTVRTECIAGFLNGYSYSHRLVLSNGRWIVTRSKLIGVS
jgi:hypothetical protein